MPAVGAEERLLGDGTGCLRPGIDILQSRHLQLEMYGAGGGERIFLGQQHQLCAGEIVLNAPVLRPLVPAIERLCRKYLLVKVPITDLGQIEIGYICNPSRVLSELALEYIEWLKIITV